MFVPRRSVRSLIVLGVLCLTVATPAQDSSPLDLVDLLRTAIARLDDAKTAAHRFTNFDLVHNQNRKENGQLYADSLNLYEDTWIADLPFKRLVAVNGRPLTGKDLDREQRRYDQAVHERSALDDAARARLVHELYMDAGLDLKAVTTSAYRLTRLREETLENRAVVVIDADPVTPDAAAIPSGAIHYTLWITTSQPTILRFQFEALANTPRLLLGSHGQKDFLVLEGTPLPAHIVVHARVSVGRETVMVDSEHTNSRYRRFQATTQMLPPGSRDPSEPPAEPQM